MSPALNDDFSIWWKVKIAKLYWVLNKQMLKNRLNTEFGRFFSMTDINALRWKSAEERLEQALKKFASCTLFTAVAVYIGFISEKTEKLKKSIDKWQKKTYNVIS